MIKENQRLLNYVNLILDGVMLIIAMACAYFVRFYIFHGESGHQAIGYYLWATLLICPFFLLLYGLAGLYESFRSGRFMEELRLIIRSNAIGVLLLITVLFVVKSIDISRWTLVIFFFFATGSVGSKRYILRQILRRYRSKGYNQKHILLVGSGKSALRYFHIVNDDKAMGFSIAGCVSDDSVPSELKKLGSLSDLEKILTATFFDEVVAAMDGNNSGHIDQIIAACEKSGTKLSLIPTFADYMPTHPYIDEVGGIPLINIRRIPLDNAGNAFMKRTIDIVGSLIGIILTSPLMLIAAVGTKLSSPGPILFRQERVGKNKKNFMMYKFRSMRVNDRQDTGWSTETDSRRTKFGAFIRKVSIDELPQLFNVLKGDMSLVGPRPEVPHFVEQFRESVPLYMVKHQVRPGITGWAQVNGLRGDTSIEDRIRHDVYYIENWSIIFDIRILLATIFKGLFINDEKL